LVFHHKDDTIKENNIADMIRGGYSLKNIKKELDKCEVLCSNCHNKEHFSKDYL
jgi:cytochrome c